jgi:hypothetical protein
MRTCQIKKDKEWININFSELKQGDIFRLFDNDIPVINNEGFTQFMAQSDAYENNEGIYQVDIMDSICE